MPSGLSVPGVLTVTQASLQEVGDSLDVNIKYAVAATDRTKADGSASFTNFIQADVDLNALVAYEASHSGKAEDDAYSLSGFSVTHVNAVNPVFSLPSVSLVDVDAGEIDAQTPGGASLGKFPVKLTVSVDDQGVMTADIAIKGSDVTPGVELLDDPHKAQVVYWTGAQAVPTVAADDSDVLGTKLTVSHLETYHRSDLDAVKAQYHNQNMLSAWSITLTKMDSAVDNILSQHARFNDKRALGAALFANNDKIVVATHFPYAVAIEDYNGNSIEIVSSQPVFGVLNHAS